MSFEDDRWRDSHEDDEDADDDDYDDDDDKYVPWSLLIPIGVLMSVMLGTGVPWLLIPVFVLTSVLIFSLSAERKMSSIAGRGHAGPVGNDAYKPIYDQKRQKEEGVSCGILIPIGIMSWLFLVSGFSWPFLISLFVLVLVFLQGLVVSIRGRGEVVERLKTVRGARVDEIADSIGITPDRARQHIVHEKRRGAADVWFDPVTGESVPGKSPIAERASSDSRTGCIYCGFALRSEDRFCPYCGAPIKIS
ncbi:MAG: zinc ribbon domain-containing protein [Candidatus Thorarchaeota archaeon]|nr:zinc ribbon domain-containing protein [Candidatus Thorarchaeota archaeon]